ncbi:MAG TPA: potassium channel family protein [Steroidobacteraceae bacterium]|jgi:voltage-gated potassium channel
MLHPFRFLQKFLSVLGAVSLVLLLLLGLFFVLATVVYFAEKGQHFNNSPASFAEALYFSAITALTVGYGDIVPHSFVGRCVSVLLALLGITLTGIVAGAAVRALQLQVEEERGKGSE